MMCAAVLPKRCGEGGQRGCQGVSHPFREHHVCHARMRISAAACMRARAASPIRFQLFDENPLHSTLAPSPSPHPRLQPRPPPCLFGTLPAPIPFRWGFNATACRGPRLTKALNASCRRVISALLPADEGHQLAGAASAPQGLESQGAPAAEKDSLGLARSPAALQRPEGRLHLGRRPEPRAVVIDESPMLPAPQRVKAQESGVPAQLRIAEAVPHGVERSGGHSGPLECRQSRVGGGGEIAVAMVRVGQGREGKKGRGRFVGNQAW